MLSIRRASEADCALIRRLAGEVFPATYREILAPAQLDYMMEWMYSEESLQGQFRAGHVWFIASSDGEPCGYVSVERQGEDLFHLQKIYVLPRFQFSAYSSSTRFTPRFPTTDMRLPSISTARPRFFRRLSSFCTLTAITRPSWKVEMSGKIVCPTRSRSAS